MIKIFQAKECHKCQRLLPAAAFYVDKRKEVLHNRCKECERAAARAWHKLNPERSLANKRRWGQTEKCKTGIKTWQLAIKDAVFIAYGGYKCVCCGETEKDFLSLDHVANDGPKMRLIHGLGSNMYRWAVKNGFPPIFQVLCRNCQFGKKKSGICPHVTVRKEFERGLPGTGMREQDYE